jgi:hypothetical protein
MVSPLVMASKSRPRKRHVQLELPRLDKNGQHRGGWRPRAGRKPKGERPSERHERRADIDARHPQHVTLRVIRGVGWLRTSKAYRAIRHALAVSLDAEHEAGAFRIVHFSLQGDHLHLICEAEHKLALARGVQGFQISAAKHLNRELGRSTGQVFPDRYFSESITTVARARHTLAYVLNNWRKHRQVRATPGLFGGRIDPFSSAIWFAGVRERSQPIAIPSDYDPPRIAAPQTWLLREGYKRARPISVLEVPGPR